MPISNSLPRTVTDNDSLGTFKSRLKTFLFSLAFNWHWHYPPPAPLKLWPNGTTQICHYYYYYNVSSCFPNVLPPQPKKFENSLALTPINVAAYVAVAAAGSLMICDKRTQDNITEKRTQQKEYIKWSSKVRLCRDRSLFKVAIQEVKGRPTGLLQSLWW